MIFNFFRKQLVTKLAFLTHNKAKLCKTLIVTLVFEKNANFFRRKLAKIAEISDHNIDPVSQSYGWLPERNFCTFSGKIFVDLQISGLE
jgi:hypothetical protein